MKENLNKHKQYNKYLVMTEWHQTWGRDHWAGDDRAV